MYSSSAIQRTPSTHPSTPPQNTHTHTHKHFQALQDQVTVLTHLQLNQTNETSTVHPHGNQAGRYNNPHSLITPKTRLKPSFNFWPRHQSRAEERNFSLFLPPLFCGRGSSKLGLCQERTKNTLKNLYWTPGSCLQKRNT